MQPRQHLVYALGTMTKRRRLRAVKSAPNAAARTTPVNSLLSRMPAAAYRARQQADTTLHPTP